MEILDAQRRAAGGGETPRPEVTIARPDRARTAKALTAAETRRRRRPFQHSDDIEIRMEDISLRDPDAQDIEEEEIDYGAVSLLRPEDADDTAYHDSAADVLCEISNAG
jgi:hypothetical protein